MKEVMQKKLLKTCWEITYKCWNNSWCFQKDFNQSICIIKYPHVLTCKNTDWRRILSSDQNLKNGVKPGIKNKIGSVKDVPK